MTLLLGISGSPRNESRNRGPLHVSAEPVPPAARLEIRDLHEVPNYNQHRDDELGGTDTPEAVLALRRRIEHADGLLLSSPEYNRSFTGVLKNALDLCSSPAVRSISAGKPTLPLGASGGPAGTWPRPGSPKTGAVHNDAGADRMPSGTERSPNISTTRVGL